MHDLLTEGDVGDFTPAEEIRFLKRKAESLVVENKKLREELKDTRIKAKVCEAIAEHLRHILNVYREERRGSKWHRILNILFP